MEREKPAYKLQEALARLGRLLRRAAGPLIRQARRIDPDLARTAAGAALICSALLFFALSILNFAYSQAARFDPRGGKPYVVHIAPGASETRHIADSYIAARKGAFVYGKARPDVIIDSIPRKGYVATSFVGRPGLTLAAGEFRKSFKRPNRYWFSGRRTSLLPGGTDRAIQDFSDYMACYYSEMKPVTMNILGDIIPGRHVAEKMAEKGVEYPFKLVAPYTRGADIVLGNLECPLTDSIKPPYSGMQFSAPASTVEGLKLLGLNIVTLANNHSTNFGRGAFEDTLKILSESRIARVGGGYDYHEAYSPVIMDVRGFKVGFIDYNSIPESIDASGSDSGVAWIRMRPWNPDSPDDFRMVEERVREAAEKSDFVVACFHWGQEYRYEPSDSMRELARRAVDAGADMVVGQHTHTIGPVELYKGGVIFYTLGNFIFDQRFSEQVRRGFILKCEFKEGMLTGLKMVPYRINNSCQTVVSTGRTAASLVNKLVEISGWRE